MHTSTSSQEHGMPAGGVRVSVAVPLLACSCLIFCSTMARPSAFLLSLPSRSHRPLLARLFASSVPNKSERLRLNIAIVGGGLSGLSTAWHLAGRVQRLTIYDSMAPGQASASAVAGGLLHPLTPKNRIIWSGLEGFEATLRLVEASKAALLNAGDEAAARRLHSSPGTILRPALIPQHVLNYQAAAAKLPEWLKWLEGEEWQCKANNPGHGLLLRNSIVLSMPDYLRGLWLSLQQTHGNTTMLTWEQCTFSNAQAIKHKKKNAGAAAYDVIVLASGAGICSFPALKHLPIELVTGRTLLVDQEEEDKEGREESAAGTSLGSALLCGEYVVPGVDLRRGEDWTKAERRVLRCGSTKEYVKDPWGQVAKVKGGEEKEEKGEEKMRALREKAERIYPPLKRRPAAYRITTGTRVATPRSDLGRVPILGRVSLRGKEGGKEEGEEVETWLYTGLGGRGLIHHAFLGAKLAEAILMGDETLLPFQVRAPLVKQREKRFW